MFFNKGIQKIITNHTIVMEKLRIMGLIPDSSSKRGIHRALLYLELAKFKSGISSRDVNSSTIVEIAEEYDVSLISLRRTYNRIISEEGKIVDPLANFKHGSARVQKEIIKSLMLALENIGPVHESKTNVTQVELENWLLNVRQI
ncbi:hypothetical protein HZR84_03795 [Hyphobacterium sp. CCMP332]|nr:hypothetical protein HZR84_03795 [Hyphobacterium sp. CCMP332]